MSDEIVLTLKGRLDGPVDASALALDRWRDLGTAEIARRGVRSAGADVVPLGQLFDVRGERAPRIRFVGDLSELEGLGTGLDGAELVIEGPIGARVGNRMRSGRIEVRGAAGWGAGLDMAGGLLEIHGDAGPRVGGAPLGAKRGMSGGEIIVRGSAAEEAGASMRRGLLVVLGSLGEGAGRATIAGTIVVFGTLGPNPGQWSKRGSIVTFGPANPPVTYRYACTYRPEVLRLLLRHLAERRGIPLTREHLSGSFRRYSGDLAELGAGEILAWTAEA
jgi:formylmethanofuran dehydrogenase subunit C